MGREDIFIKRFIESIRKEFDWRLKGVNVLKELIRCWI